MSFLVALQLMLIFSGHDVLYMTDQEQEKYNLPPGMPSPYYHPNRPSPPPQNFYVLSIMHQMHCLVCFMYIRTA